MFNADKLDTHKPEDYQRFLKLAGKTIECSWLVFNIHRKTSGWETILMFADETNERFAFAFSLRGGVSEITALCTRLKAAQDKCDRLNNG